MTEPIPANIDTVRDVLAKLGAMFPKHRDEILAWSQLYQRVLGHLPPARLREVFFAVVEAWDKPFAPRPVDFKAKLGADAKPEAPNDPGAVAAGRRNKALMEAHTRRDNLAKQIAIATFEHYSTAIEEAAQRVGVKAEDMLWRLKTTIGWPGLAAQKGTRAYDAAHAHVFGNEPLVEYIHLTADDWNGARRYAEIKRDDPNAFDFSQPVYGFRSITNAGAANPEREERRRDSIAQAQTA